MPTVAGFEAPAFFVVDVCHDRLCASPPHAEMLVAGPVPPAEGVLVTDLEVGHTYFWRVRTLDSGGESATPPSPTWLFHVAAEGSFASSFGALTDLDGDGLSDSVTAYETAGASGSTGRVHVVYTSSTATAVVLGELEASRRYGDALASGDFDGDGFVDLAVAAPDPAEPPEARIHVHHGSPRGVSSAATVTLLTSPLEFPGVDPRSFGASLALAGDINDDGFADLLVGDPEAEPSGYVVIFYGSLVGLSSDDAEVIIPSSGLPLDEGPIRFGASMVGVGDLDDNYHDDFVVGAPENDPGSGGSDANGVLLLWMSHGDPPYYVSTTMDHDKVGTSIAMVGPRRSGEVLLAAGNPNSTGGGAVRFFLASYMGITPTLDAIFIAPDDEAFGTSLSGGEDLDGDGRFDLVVGSPRASAGSGSAYLYLMRGLGPVRQRCDTDRFGVEFVDMGETVTMRGDTDGDGEPEVLVGSPSSHSGEGAVLVCERRIDGSGDFDADEVLPKPLGALQYGRTLIP